MAPTQVAQVEEQPMSTQELLQAHLELYHHSFAFVKSMALRAAVQLGIPGCVHRRGGRAILSELAGDTGLHRTKSTHPRWLMRSLTVSGVFAEEERYGEAVYCLSRVSRLLVGNGRTGSSSHSLSPMVVNPVAATALFSMCEWLSDERAASAKMCF